MIGDWTFYTCELISGDLVIDLPLVEFSGEVALTGGSMSATVPLQHLDSPARQAILESTIPGRYSIVAKYQGIVRGEWIIWQRDRSNDLAPIDLAGAEVISFLERRVVPGKTYTQIEQLDIAADLIAKGFGPSPLGNGSIQMSVGAYTASGQKRDRTYTLGDGTIGGRLKELGAVQNGFDYYIESIETGNVGTTTSIQRTARLAYPRAGNDQDLVLEDRNVIDFKLTEDAQRLASRTYAIGENALVSNYENDSLITAGRMPFMEKTESHTSVSDSATLDGYARALWDDSQTDALPGDLLILADRHPGIGDWQLGDILTLVLEESVNFPIGLRVDVRIISWSFKPPSSGPETMTLGITQEGPIGDYSGNPITLG